MNKRKILVLTMALSMVAILAAGATLAYFTDTDSAENIFTVGSVEIDLIESQYSRHNMGNHVDGMVSADEKVQDHTWDGTFYPNAKIEEDAETYEGMLTTKGTFANLVPGQVIEKNAYIKNTGKNDAYVRMRILMRDDLFEKNSKNQNMFTFMYTSAAILNKDITLSFDEANKVKRDGVDYNEWTFTFEKVLKAGEMTFWSPISKVYIDKHTTSAEVNAISDLEDGFYVIVEADAIQAEGFTSAEAAFAAFDAN